MCKISLADKLHEMVGRTFLINYADGSYLLSLSEEGFLPEIEFAKRFCTKNAIKCLLFFQ